MFSIFYNSVCVSIIFKRKSFRYLHKFKYNSKQLIMLKYWIINPLFDDFFLSPGKNVLV